MFGWFRRGRLAAPRIKELVLIDRTIGTNIGNMTIQGGLAAAFDGNAAPGFSNSASAGGTTAYVGKSLPSPRRFGQAVVYGSTDFGYMTASGNITFSVYGKQGAAPTGATNGTLIGSLATFSDGSGVQMKTINSTDLVTAWDHIWLTMVTTNTSGGNIVGELQLSAWE